MNKERISSKILAQKVVERGPIEGGTIWTKHRRKNPKLGTEHKPGSAQPTKPEFWIDPKMGTWERREFVLHWGGNSARILRRQAAWPPEEWVKLRKDQAALL